MKEALYQMLNLQEIQALVQSEHDNPHQILGPHMTREGVWVGAFDPMAEKVYLRYDKNEKEVPMEPVEGGYYACLLPVKSIPAYSLRYVYSEGQRIVKDPYAFEALITEGDCRAFNAGIHYSIYEKLGAHPMTMDGVVGTYFAVWAPNAMRVSVVGDFNHWDGRLHPMRRLKSSGIFELFVPGIGEGELYKFELKAQGGLTYLKADPYACASELRPGTASRVADLRKFEWTDVAYCAQRDASRKQSRPMSVYEVHPGSWKKTAQGEEGFHGYRELAHQLAEYVTEMGYTHVQLMPVMEHPLDASWGYQITGYYSVTSRYGAPEDFMYFVNYMHEHGIGVILDTVFGHFPKDAFGLSAFDGTCLYEHLDPKQANHPQYGTLMFNYGRKEVSNFLIACALFWLKTYHVDGLRMDVEAATLYLDYGRGDKEWVPNLYGGNENLDAIEFLKHLNSIVHKKCPWAMTIAEESTGWPCLTGPLDEDGLGFDYKWNIGWRHDFITYMRQDPLFRRGCHGALTFSMIYAYSENFILALPHDEVVHGKGNLLEKMPGTMEERFANLRVAYGFQFGHPGKKLLFMGQDMAQTEEWNEKTALAWEALEKSKSAQGGVEALAAQLNRYIRDWNHLYKESPAMYTLDHDPDGFEWMSCLDADHSIVTFVRKTDKPEETLFFVCNFTPVAYEKQSVGVPFAGKYKEIFNSDATIYGGKGYTNPRLRQSKEERVDGRDESITITIPPLGCAVFSCTPIHKER